MTDDKKRYIVTYKDANIGFEGASQILGVAQDKLQDGVASLASDKPLEASDINHFDGVGSTALSLTPEQAEALKGNDRVAAVEEDLPMHILQLQDGSLVQDIFDSGSDEMLYGDDSDAIAQFGDVFRAGYQQVTAETYQSGYKQALADTYKYLLDRSQAGGAGEMTESDLPVPGRPPVFHPVPIFPPRPIPRPFPFPLPTQPIPWNIKLVKANMAWSRATGRGVKVAILDTGIAAHPDLTIHGGASFVPGVASYNDGHGHGTHCAGIVGARNNFLGVVGVAPRCSLYAVKVLSDGGSGQTEWILAGMEWAFQNRMQVVSMSLGSVKPAAGTPCPVAYQNAAQKLLNIGCVVVAAAGNSGATGQPWVNIPANGSNFVAVAAVDGNKVIAPFSSRGVGNIVALSAPGVSVNSTSLGNGYKVLSGTSMACPHVAGAAALIRERFPSFTAAQMRARLTSTAADLGVPGADPGYGAGLLDCLAAIA